MARSPARPARPAARLGQLRIIGGKWRSRRLNFPEAPGLRPTPDRVRETLFNWLAPYVEGARVLDPFAGSGALLLEALSRGALRGLGLELDSAAARALRDNFTLLQAKGSRTRAPSTWAASQLNRVSRTRSGVGRRPGASGKARRRERHWPAMIRSWPWRAAGRAGLTGDRRISAAPAGRREKERGAPEGAAAAAARPSGRC